MEKGDIHIPFFSSGTFGATVLRHLLDAGWIPSFVVSTPDAPVGRHQVLTPNPVSALARERGLRLLQFPKLKREQAGALWNLIEQGKPSLAVLADFGLIVPKSFIALFPSGIANIHPSLLPRYRGASPIQSVIANGDMETGVSLMLIDEQVDHGPLLAQEHYPLHGTEVTPELSSALANVGTELLLKVLPQYASGRLSPTPQQHEQATFTKMLVKADGQLNPSHSAEVNERKIRAFQPWPGCWLELIDRGKPLRLKVLQAHKGQERLEAPKPAPALTASGEFAIICGSLDNGFAELILDQVQPSDGRPMSGVEFLRGHLAEGLKLIS